jgi:hypothetical protein
MTFATAVALPALGMLFGMLAFLEVGGWLGRRRRDAGEEVSGGTIDGAVFALFGLVIAFTFAGASDRLDYRRKQIVAEANAIGTAYLRLDLLPGETQASLRELFRRYVRARIATYDVLPDETAARVEYDRSIALQGEIWSRALPAARSEPSPAVAVLVLPSLNDMFDIANARLAASRAHVPGLILALLLGLALASALVVGYATSTSRRRWFRGLLFATVTAISVFIILDLEYPRFGLIQLRDQDVALREVLQSMQ